MINKNKVLFAILLIIALLLSIFLYPYAMNSAVLDPKGLISLKQEDLMIIATLMMLIIVIPVLLMTFAICWRYRASNKNAEYAPNWSHDTLAEIIWWGFPCLIVFLLSFVTWTSSHDLDPYKPFRSSVKPVNIQVVALQWKWLFIYPELKIASLNYLQFPENTPLNFEITADAPMNSFWIPQLGGQIYAMPGMRTKLHLLALEPGEYRGSSANLSGTGFSGMNFIAKAGSNDQFDEWIKSANASSKVLNETEYQQLLRPSEYDSAQLFTLEAEGLFDQIVMKYLEPIKEVEPTKLAENYSEHSQN